MLADEFPTIEAVTFDMIWYLLWWHGMAKLREHTETTLRLLAWLTTAVGNAVRKFADLTAALETSELPSEEAARGRRDINEAKRREERQTKRGKKRDAAGNPKGKAAARCSNVAENTTAQESQVIQGDTEGTQNLPATSSSARKQSAQNEVPTRKKKIMLNLARPKWHSMGHYVEDIRNHGCTDGFSTQGVRFTAHCIGLHAHDCATARKRAQTRQDEIRDDQQEKHGTRYRVPGANGEDLEPNE